MDIATNSVRIKGTSDPAGAIIMALCNFGTPEEPLIPTNAEKWAAIKTVRNELLVLCDWTQTLDAPLTPEQRAAWTRYRQILRDIPQTYASPESVVWPTAPS